MDLTPALDEALAPLFAAWPPDQAMVALCPAGPAPAAAVEAARAVIASLPGSAAHLAAGVWLYVDDLDASHRVSQDLPDALGSFWHAVMHRREGDFPNARYWLNRVRPTPDLAVDGYEPYAFLDEVAAAVRRGDGAAPDLVARQRAEWAALMALSARA